MVDGRVNVNVHNAELSFGWFSILDLDSTL